MVKNIKILVDFLGEDTCSFIVNDKR